MKKINFLSIIPAIVIIIGMIILSGCSTPSEDSSSSQVGKNKSSDQTSTEALMLAAGAGSRVVFVAAGNHFSMAIVLDSSHNSTLWVIGYNGYGQLGLGDTKNRTTWQKAGLTNVKNFACGNNNAICTTGDWSEVWVTGDNSYGQLGLGYTGGIVKKWTKTSFKAASNLACGYTHCMFQTVDTSSGNTRFLLYEAGNNNCGQLGLNPSVYPKINTWTPVVNQTSTINRLACGAYHSMYVSGANNIYVTGNNDYGQLGLGYSGGNVTQWTRVTNISSIQIDNVACGDYHSVISAYGPLLSYPSLYSSWIWVTGANWVGQIGYPSSTWNISTWQQLALGNIVAIACGANHSMFNSSGSLWVTGRNNKGQLGIGSTADTFGWQPTQYGNLQNNIAGGTEHSLFVSQNSTWGAGSNTYRELGKPSFKNPYSVWFIQN